MAFKKYIPFLQTAKFSKRTSCCRPAFVFVTTLGLASLLYALVYVRPNPFPHGPGSSKPHDVQPEQLLVRESILDVPALISALKKATKEASSNLGQVKFTNAEKKEWRSRNPCRSRTELQPFYSRRRFSSHVGPNSKWESVLLEYEKLHRACFKRVGGDFTSYFMRKDNSSGCKFVVAGHPEWAGLGNKVLSMVSALLYAILTQRVFLLPVATDIPDIMCEPFEGSSWRVDPDRLFTPIEQREWLWSSVDLFEEQIDNATTRQSVQKSTIYGVRVAHWCQPDKRFFCDTEQAYYSEVQWMYFTSCLYFLPKLFAIPSFRPVLEDMFPERMVLTHMLRSVMLPSDPVWRRVLQTDRMYLEAADRRVGIQMRYRDKEPQFIEMHDTVNRRVVECGVVNGVLPDPGKAIKVSHDNGLQSEVSSPSTELIANRPFATSVFVTSLFQGLQEHLTQVYVRNPPVSGETIGVVQLTHGKIQGSGVEEDTQALTEVMILSFSDHLFVTPLSTFGGLAQGYGGLTPWFIEFRNDNTLPPCTQGQTIDPCYQNPVERIYSCPYESSLNGKVISEVVPYIKDCLAMDAPAGLQLLTPNLARVQ